MAEFHEPLLKNHSTTSSERMQLISGRDAYSGTIPNLPPAPRLVLGRLSAHSYETDFQGLPTILRDHGACAFWESVEAVIPV
jgi:hypothetical protein